MHEICPVARLTKAERMASERLAKSVYWLDDNIPNLQLLQLQIPNAWATLEADIDDDEPKERITLRLNQSVARYFRSMGAGYQTRINHILCVYAQMQILKHNERWKDLLIAEPATAKAILGMNKRLAELDGNG